MIVTHVGELSRFLNRRSIETRETMFRALMFIGECSLRFVMSCSASQSERNCLNLLTPYNYMRLRICVKVARWDEVHVACACDGQMICSKN